jgi:anthranilate synthase/aminodeoxychorismate synthase-like glutamine amidotransferase
MIVMIDNYDSFTYNLVQYIEQMGCPVHVIRNDAVSIEELEKLNPAGVVISPGPGNPDSAGISLAAVKTFSGRIPILGVCLGHQTIGQAFGGQVVPARALMHGKTSMVRADGKAIYKGIHKPFQAMRYHSLVLNRETLPDCLAIVSETDDGEIMGVRHRSHPTEGIQFHPESIMTPVGKRLLRNFLNTTATA